MSVYALILLYGYGIAKYDRRNEFSTAPTLARQKKIIYTHTIRWLDFVCAQFTVCVPANAKKNTTQQQQNEKMKLKIRNRSTTNILSHHGHENERTRMENKEINGKN